MTETTELHQELLSLIELCGGPTLGGNETVEELLEVCEDCFGDII